MVSKRIIYCGLARPSLFETNVDNDSRCGTARRASRELLLTRLLYFDGFTIP